jgi:hypothetical protein
MKKTILATALALASLQGNLFAQMNSYQEGRLDALKQSKTEQTFNPNYFYINLKDFVTLKEGKMTLEMHYFKDFDNFRNIDSVLAVAMKDIAFYADSLNADPTGHLRIDYVANTDYSFKKIRFKRYPSDGNIFMNQDGEISKLKFDQDTVNIIIQKSRESIGSKKCTIPYSIRASFIVGNYTDINKIVASKELPPIMDTLEKMSQPRNRKINQKSKPNELWSKPMSIIYNPYYYGEGAVTTYKKVLDNEYDVTSPQKNDKLLLGGSVGIGLIRNMITPTADIAITLEKYYRKNKYNDYDFFSVSVSPYFLFEKNVEGGYITDDNWFINAEVGTVYHKKAYGWVGNMVSFGAGYLFRQKGGYFQNTTLKIFTSLEVTKGITISPELISTNNFKQIFPGITLKVL